MGPFRDVISSSRAFLTCLNMVMLSATRTTLRLAPIGDRHALTASEDSEIVHSN